ncbi:MAG TPA: hypothetical protein VD811_05070 [Desulfuromonadales bacterium]|nr:hypothetical protein [Desulfuromonadales bacterium]
MKRRSSLQISLVLVGMVALTGCQQEQRNVYKSREDCLQDWGSGQECEEVTAANSSYGGSHHPVGYFFGPRYYGSGGTLRGTPSVRAFSVARGGFGSMAGFHGGGG